ncbi:MAG: PLP-dependent aminotransferase family protein [Lachnospiraceae bacterium]|nr:PLP-dependent aminotransferase family protein [Lachnospiraceae bacterium]
MLTYDMEQRGSKPLYEYLYICIREDILKGFLKPGEKLPSKREMSKNLNIALITVENAYAQLIIEGYVTAREKRGYFVNAVTTGTGTEIQGAKRGIQSGDKNKAKKAAEAAWVVDFSSLELKEDAFPFKTWAKLMRRILEERQEAFLQKPEGRGVPELRRAVAEYLRKAKGLNVTADRIVVGPGTEYLHHLILQLLGPGKIVAVEDPGYKKVGMIYESNGVKCLHVPVDENGLIVEKLKKSNAGLVHVSPSHHFPTGCVMPIGRRKALLEWAENENAFILEDDYDSEFRFDGRPVPALASLDDEKVIYLNTFTKTLAPSIRIAYMVLPETLNRRYDEKLSFYSGAVPSFEQYTLAAFIGEGYYERHVSRMRNYYRTQRARILQAFWDSKLSAFADVEEHAAGLHFILKLHTNNDEEVLKTLSRKRIRLTPVSDYCYNDREKYNHSFLVYYTDQNTEKIRWAFDLIAESIKK